MLFTICKKRLRLSRLRLNSVCSGFVPQRTATYQMLTANSQQVVRDVQEITGSLQQVCIHIMSEFLLIFTFPTISVGCTEGQTKQTQHMLR